MDDVDGLAQSIGGSGGRIGSIDSMTFYGCDDCSGAIKQITIEVAIKSGILYQYLACFDDVISVTAERRP